MHLLQWALVAFVVAIMAGLFGFTGVAQDAASVGGVVIRSILSYSGHIFSAGISGC
jgi:uncharacterized membrane protein YtjA (UPF0391 family)